MIETIEKVLSPVSLVASILGLGILRYPLNQPKYRLYILYILIVWSVYIYALYYMMIMILAEGVFDSLVTSLVVTVNLLVAIISIIMNIGKHEKYRRYIRKLDLVDDTLEKLGIKKEYLKMRNLTRQALIVWFLSICAIWTSDSSFYNIIAHDDSRTISFIPIIFSYIVHVNSITDIMFILLLRYIGVVLDKINDHIEQLSKTEDCGLRCKWKKSLIVNSHYARNAMSRKHILWTVIHLHLELCRTARDINVFFGIQITLQMMSYFLILNGMFYLEYCVILHLKELYENNMILYIFFSNTIWIVTLLMKLILLNHICESVNAKAQKTKNIIHKLTNLTCFAKVREEIYQFVLQISLRPLKFNGWGLFYFGYDFIRKFFVWILTTIIFMAQINFTFVRIDTYYSNNNSPNE